MAQIFAQRSLKFFLLCAWVSGLGCSANLNAQSCEKNQVKVGTPASALVKFEEACLSSTNSGTTFSVTVKNLQENAIKSIAIDISVESLSGEHLFTVQSLSWYDELDDKEDVALGFSTWGEGLDEMIRKGARAKVSASSPFTFGNKAVKAKIVRAALHFEDKTRKIITFAPTISEVQPISGAELSVSPPTECKNETNFELTITEEGATRIPDSLGICSWLEKLVKSWRFRPALRDGKPIARTIKVLVTIDSSNSANGNRARPLPHARIAIVPVGKSPVWVAYFGRRPLWNPVGGTQ